jgi:hypothetical protein
MLVALLLLVVKAWLHGAMSNPMTLLFLSLTATVVSGNDADDANVISPI